MRACMRESSRRGAPSTARPTSDDDRAPARRAPARPGRGPRAAVDVGVAPRLRARSLLGLALVVGLTLCTLPRAPAVRADRPADQPADRPADPPAGEPTAERGSDAKPPWPRYLGKPVEPIRGSTRIDGLQGAVRLPPALQGDVVQHDIVLRNDGTTPIALSNVKACSGCVLDGYSPRIAPGSEGRISIVLLTDSRGGQAIDGRVRAQTDDPARPEVVVDVYMEVKEFAALEPYRVWLEGKVGEPIVATCIVTPNEAYPFEITGIKPSRGKGYALEVEEIERQGRRAWALTLTNTRSVPGPYQDVLYVQTSHPERPELKIRVEGRIEPAG